MVLIWDMKAFIEVNANEKNLNNGLETGVCGTMYF
jgi:hypothetical protein